MKPSDDLEMISRKLKAQIARCQQAEAQVAELIATNAALKAEIEEYAVAAALDRAQMAELDRAKDQAETANASKGEFLATISHELRNPLQSILGFTQLLRQESLSFDGQQYTGIIYQNVEHVLALVSEIAEFAKIEAGQMVIHTTCFDLHHLLRSLESSLKLKAQDKKLLLLLDCDATVPRYITTDEGKLYQILLNLLDNAIKFTPQGTVTLRVRGQGTPLHRPHLLPYPLFFAVEDTGVGIASREQNQLFQPFQQTQSGRQTQSGAGLGLYISQKLVQGLGGTLTVESSLERGSCFAFHIPVQLAEVPASRSPSESWSNLPPHQSPQQPSHRILVVEDDVTQRLLIAKWLQQLGFEVQEGGNGQVAVTLWCQWQPHLILMDRQMPIMSGDEATQLIKQVTTEQNVLTPVIIALDVRPSAATPSNPQEALGGCDAHPVQEQSSPNLQTWGYDDLIYKPFQRSELVEKLRKHLDVQLVDVKVIESSTESGKFKHTRNSSPKPLPALRSADLTILSTSWIEQLHHASAQGSASICLHLIAQIPAKYVTLIEGLSNLVKQGQFEQLMRLTYAADRQSH